MIVRTRRFAPFESLNALHLISDCADVLTTAPIRGGLEASLIRKLHRSILVSTTTRTTGSASTRFNRRRFPEDKNIYVLCKARLRIK